MSTRSTSRKTIALRDPGGLVGLGKDSTLRRCRKDDGGII